MVNGAPKESIKGENALYIFNRLLRMATETELSTWKQNQVRNFLKHDKIDEILSLTDGFGRTLLDNACAAGNLRLVQQLKPMGAKLGKPHVTMSIVCSDEHLPIFDYLLAHDPKLCNTEVVVGDEDDDTDRMPMLNLCAKKGDLKPLSVLLTYGFKTAESISSSVDRAGNTPLHVVRQEKIAALLLNHSGIEILGKPNLRGQRPIDCLLERYAAIPSLNRFGLPVGYEEDLKQTIGFINTLTSRIPRRSSNSPLRTTTPPTLPRVTSLTSVMGTSSPLRIPPRDIPKSFLSRDMISKAAINKRVALLQEQREQLKAEVADLQMRRMIDLNPHELAMKHQHQMLALKQQSQNPLSIMGSSIKKPQSPNRKGYIDAINAAFASEQNTSVGPSLSLLAAALSNHSKNKNLMLNQNDLRMRATASKCFLPQAQMGESELHKLLRANEETELVTTGGQAEEVINKIKSKFDETTEKKEIVESLKEYATSLLKGGEADGDFETYYAESIFEERESEERNKKFDKNLLQCVEEALLEHAKEEVLRTAWVISNIK